MRSLLYALVLSLVATSAGAVEPDEVLSDPALEMRARELSQQLRCVVCQNQDIDSSNAGVARTMRILLRERLVAGDSDEDVLQFFVQRYGNFVLFKPPLKTSTYLLWFSPLALFVVGAGVVFLTIRRQSSPGRQVTELTSEEERTVGAMLGQKGGGDR